jgi:hypothetical protein
MTTYPPAIAVPGQLREVNPVPQVPQRPFLLSFLRTFCLG